MCFDIERLAERYHVARRRHGHADPEHGLVAEAHVLARRIGVLALDGRDVREPDGAAIHANQGIAQLGDVLELPARAHIDTIVGGSHQPRAGYGVLRIDGIRDLLRCQVEFRELRVGDLDIHALLLIRDEVDLVDVRHAQQLGAQAFGVIMQLRG